MTKCDFGSDAIEKFVAANEAQATRFMLKNISKNDTATVAVSKIGKKFVSNSSVDETTETAGKIETTDMTDELASRLFFPQKRTVNKGTFGKAYVVAGSEIYPGAALLSALAAEKVGAGYSGLFTVKKVANTLLLRRPELLTGTLPERRGKITPPLFGKKAAFSRVLGAESLAVGMGMTPGRGTYRTVKFLLANFGGTLIIDADGLNALAAFGTEILKSRNKNCRVVLTPHPAEFARLTGKRVAEILASPEKTAAAFAKEFGVTVLLKGADTIVTDGAEIYRSSSGSPGMAKAGSGDVLSGVLCGLFARKSRGNLQFSDPFVAAAGAFLAGRAGEKAESSRSPYTTDPVREIDCLSSVIDDWYRKNLSAGTR